MKNTIDFHLEKAVGLLNNFFAKRSSVSLVFIFGSAVRGYLTNESDIDIAILFSRPPTFSKILNLKSKLTDILKAEVDIAILNTASPILRMQVLKKGVLVFKSSDKIYSNFFVETLNQYEDLKYVREICEKNVLKGSIYG